jgi:Na+/melibiose symporter-like transporter
MAPLPSWASLALASQPDPRSYQIALLFAGIIAAPSFIPLFLMSNTRPRRRQANVSQDGRAHDISTRTNKASLRVLLRTLTWAQLKKVLVSPFFLLVMVQVLIGLGAGLFVPYFNLFFVKHLGASSALFGLIDGGANTITALLTLAAPWLATRIGKVNTMVWTRLISIPLMITIGLTGFLPLAATLYLFRQGMMDMSQGILQVFSMEAVPEQRRGVANSSYQASFQVAEAATTPVGGLMIVHLGYSSVFFLAAAFYLPAIGILWRRFGRGREKRDDNEGLYRQGDGPEALTNLPGRSPLPVQDGKWQT